MTKRIKSMSDDAMNFFAENNDSDLKDAGFGLYKAALHLDSFIKSEYARIDKDFKKEIDDSFDDKSEEAEKFGDEFTEGLED